MYEYHKRSKSDRFLRKALYEEYQHKCVYCGDLLFPKNMQVDHILATNASAPQNDVDFEPYLEELRASGFNTEKPDYIENYLPACQGDNCRKNRYSFRTNNLRYYHDLATQQTDSILKRIESYKKKEPADIDDFKPENMSVQCLTGMPPLVTDKDIIHRGLDIKKILEMLEGETPAVLLSGFGGIGKTALAQLLFHKIKGEFDEVAWIPYHGSLKNSAIAAIQGLDNYKTEEEKWSAITALKNDGKKKLVVIDNADHDEKTEQKPAKDTDLRAITGWGDARVIVTSRLDHLRGYQSYSVGFLSPEECLELFFHYSEHRRTPDNEATAKELIKLARCHTFTVELLAKGGNCESSLREYCNALTEKGFSFPEIEIDADKDKASATIAEHLKMLFDLQTRTADQTKFLQCLATLPEGASLSKNEIRDWFGFGINVYDSLVKAGWISRNEGMYAMHPLVKEIILLDDLPKDTAEQFLSFIEDYHNNYFPSGEVYTATMRKLEIIESVLNTLPKTVDKDTTQFANIYHNAASAFDDLADYDNALSFYQKDLRISEAKLGTDHPDTAATYNNIAGVYQAKGDYDNALRFNKKALRIRKAKLGTGHPSTATTYNNIAGVYQDKGDYDNALSFYQKALKIYEAKLGTDHPSTATTYNNIALVYYDKGDYDNALRFYQKALRIREVKLGTDHPDTAITYTNIGVLQYQTKSYQDGLENLLKAFLVFTSRLGLEHPYTKTAFSWLPDCYIAAYPDGEPFEDWLQKQLDANTEE